MALTLSQKRMKMMRERSEAIEIIDRIETILSIGASSDQSLAYAQVCDIRNLIGRYHRGEA